MTLAHATETHIQRFGRGDQVFADLDPLGVTGARRFYARNEEIYGESEEADHVYRVLSGAVRTYKILSDGRRQISEFCLPGDVFGLEGQAAHRLSAEAVNDAEILVIKRRALDGLAAVDGDAARKLWALSMHDLDRTRDHMLMLGRKSALERVACFLMDMAKRIPADRDILLPVSRQDIADYLGLTIETVSRTMTQLQDDAVIELHGCRHVVLCDRRRMEDLVAD